MGEDAPGIPMSLSGILLLCLSALSPLPPRDAPPGQDASPDQDARYSALTRSGITMHYAPGDSLRAERLLTLLVNAPGLPGLPPGLPATATVYLAASEDDFLDFAGGQVPEWSAGLAIPSTGTIVLPMYADDRTRGWSEERVMRHEWAHLGLHEYLRGLRVPRWFSEGYAEWASGGWNAAEGWRLRVAMAGGRTPPLDSLALRWPSDRASAEIAYMLSATAVEYLVASSGERGLALFLSRWREGNSFEAALRRTFGVTSGQLEEDWGRYVRRRYGWLLVLSQSLVFWAFLGTLLAVMVVVRRRRGRWRLARLRATELPDDPAFWLDPRPHDRDFGDHGKEANQPPGSP